MVTQPLDFWTIFVNYFAGGIEIFFFLAMILFAYAAARFRMPSSIFLMLIVLFIVSMSTFFSLLYTLTILAMGLFFYYTLSKIIKT